MTSTAEPTEVSGEAFAGQLEEEQLAEQLAPTGAGRAGIARIVPGQRRWAQAVTDEIGADELRPCVQTLNRVVEVAGRAALS